MASFDTAARDCFPSQTAMDIQFLPTPEKVPESVKLHCTPFECYISRSKNRMRYIKTAIRKDLYSNFEYTFRRAESEWIQKYRDNPDYELRIHKWEAIYKRYTKFVTSDERYTRMGHDMKRLSVTLCFVCENMFLVKPQFTFGLRIVGEKERHVIQTFHTPMLFYVSRRRQSSDIPERQFLWTNHHLYQPYELKPFTVYCVPSGTKYILIACDYTLFALQRVHESVSIPPDGVADPLTHKVIQIKEGVGKSVLASTCDKSPYFGETVKTLTSMCEKPKNRDRSGERSRDHVSEKPKSRDHSSSGGERSKNHSSGHFKIPSGDQNSKRHERRGRESSVMPLDKKPSFYNQSTRTLGRYKIPKRNNDALPQNHSNKTVPPPNPVAAATTTTTTAVDSSKNSPEDKFKELVFENFFKLQSFSVYDPLTQVVYCWKCEIVVPETQTDVPAQCPPQQPEPFHFTKPEPVPCPPQQPEPFQFTKPELPPPVPCQQEPFHFTKPQPPVQCTEPPVQCPELPVPCPPQQEPFHFTKPELPLVPCPELPVPCPEPPTQSPELPVPCPVPEPSPTDLQQEQQMAVRYLEQEEEPLPFLDDPDLIKFLDQQPMDFQNERAVLDFLKDVPTPPTQQQRHCKKISLDDPIGMETQHNWMDWDSLEAPPDSTNSPMDMISEQFDKLEEYVSSIVPVNG